MTLIAYFKTDAPIDREGESATWQSLLSSLYRLELGKDLPPIEKTPLGKPYLKNDPAHKISAAHSGGAVAVCLSDEGEVGIDVEGEIEEARCDRIRARFPYVQHRNLPTLRGARIFSAEKIGDSLSLKEETHEICTDSAFTRAWTLTEALLKAEGGGFRSSDRLEHLEKHTEEASFKIETYYFTIAKITDICK